MSYLGIVMYHYTRDLEHSRYPRISGLDINSFREQILYLKERFSIVTMEQVLDSVAGECDLPTNAVLLTFDDGYIDNYTYALPILEEAKVQGSFFIPGKTFTEHKLLDVNKIHYTLASANVNILLGELLERMNYYRGQEFNFPLNEELFEKYAVANRFDNKETIFIKRMLQTILPERLRSIISSELFQMHLGISEETLAHELYLSLDQLYTMKRHGMYIGVHGYDHYWLGELQQEDARRDIDLALESLGDLINPNKWVMNYPYGSYNSSVIDYVRAKGATLGLTTRVGWCDLEQDNLLEIPRLDCNDFFPKSDNFIRYIKI